MPNVPDIDPLLARLMQLKEHAAALIQADPLAREAARRLAAWLNSALDRSGGIDASNNRAAVDHIAPSPPAVPSAIPSPPPPPIQHIELNIDGQRRTLEVPGTHAEAEAARQAADRTNGIVGYINLHAPSAQQGDLTFVPRRCAVKADGCEWAARYRDHWELNPVDDPERKMAYDDIITRARALPNCYVWATNPKLTIPPAATMKLFSHGYRNLGDAAELAERAQRERTIAEAWRLEAYCLLAEAQSALRAALDREGLFVDPDQEAAFWWLRTRTYEDRLLVPRHMKLDDPARIEEAESLGARLENLRQRMDARRESDSHRRTLMNKARYHARLLRDGKSNDESLDWRRLIEVVDSIVAGGMPASDLELREMIAPLLDSIPEALELPDGVRRVMESVDAYLSTREAETSDEPPPARTVSREVAEIADLLEGTTVVLIGGECRPQSQRALERDFRLDELRWVAALHHQSHYTFEPAISRPETSVVLLAIRWSSHSFENAKSLCERYGKPFVRLPGGYNPNQVAAQILAQVGDTLRAVRA